MLVQDRIQLRFVNTICEGSADEVWMFCYLNVMPLDSPGIGYYVRPNCI